MLSKTDEALVREVLVLLRDKLKEDTNPNHNVHFPMVTSDVQYILNKPEPTTITITVNEDDPYVIKGICNSIEEVVKIWEEK